MVILQFSLLEPQINFLFIKSHRTTSFLHPSDSDHHMYFTGTLEGGEGGERGERGEEGRGEGGGGVGEVGGR